MRRNTGTHRAVGGGAGGRQDTTPRPGGGIVPACAAGSRYDAGMTIDDLPPITPNPVIEAYKKDIDRTLLRENLRRTPAERSRRLQEMERMRAEFARARAARRAARLTEVGAG